MSAITKPRSHIEPLLSLAELARRCNVSEPRARRLKNQGVLLPDFVGGKSFLFAPERIEELQTVIKAYA